MIHHVHLENGSFHFRAPDSAELRKRGRLTVRGEYEEGTPPRRIRLRFAKDVVIPLEEESEPDAETETDTGKVPVTP